MTAYLIFAGVLALAALTFLFLLLREGRPRDATSWAGVGMSVALLCASIAVAVMATHRPPEIRTLPPASTPDLQTPEVGQAAAPLDFRLLAGERETSLAAFRGRVVVLNFWATWCVPCLAELPALDRLQEAYGALGLQVITLSDEDPETLRAFGDERLPQHATVAYLDGVEAALPFYRRGIDFRPVTYVIDREGIVRAVDLGARTYDHFEEQVQTWLQPNLAGR